MKRILVLPALLGGLLVAGWAAQPTASAPTPTVAEAAAARTLVVHKSPTCGCCDKWEDHLRAHGFEIDSRKVEDMASVKARSGVPARLGSCHTGEIEGYVIEGHVPARTIDRLLAERPDAKGLFVPGMPLGSPGMEVPGRSEPYDVLLLRHDGSVEVFEHVEG